jgi:hypothetical protein
MAIEMQQDRRRANMLACSKTALKPGLAVLAALFAIAWGTVGVSQPPIPTTAHPAAGRPQPLGQALGQPLGQRIGNLAPGEGVAQVGSAGEMIGFSHSDGAGTQTITLVHTGKFWMAVYHIDRSGKIRLVSSRPVDADFSLQLNATSPLPEEIREIGR